MELVDLGRFQLEGVLGSGSDYEVHAATDMETGDPVVVKRPNPDYIARRLHAGVDQLSQRLIEVDASLGDSLPGVCRLAGYAEAGRHDGYFGDSLTDEYWVLVYERARGIPLAADIRDKFRGVPTGLGQNLFAIHPLAPHSSQGHFPVHQQLLDVEDAFLRAGHLLLDMRPQNVYYDPKEGKIAVIDIGTMPAGGPASQGRTSLGEGPKDFHDFFAEVFRFYTTPSTPPTSVAGYREPAGMRNIPQFGPQVRGMISSFAATTDAGLGEMATGILHRILDRSYASLEDFRGDLDQYLAALAARNRGLPELPDLKEVWGQALRMLSEGYWQKYLFDPESDLVPYLL